MSLPNGQGITYTPEQVDNIYRMMTAALGTGNPNPQLAPAAIPTPQAQWNGIFPAPSAMVHPFNQGIWQQINGFMPLQLPFDPRMNMPPQTMFGYGPGGIAPFQGALPLMPGMMHMVPPQMLGVGGLATFQGVLPSMPEMMNVGGPAPSSIVLDPFSQHVRNMKIDELFKVVDEMKKTHDESHKKNMMAIVGWREFVDSAHRNKDSLESLLQKLFGNTEPEEELREAVRMFRESFTKVTNNYIEGHATLVKAMEFRNTFFRIAHELRGIGHAQPAVRPIPIEEDDDIVFLKVVPGKKAKIQRRKSSNPTRIDGPEVRVKEEPQF